MNYNAVETFVNEYLETKPFDQEVLLRSVPKKEREIWHDVLKDAARIEIMPDSFSIKTITESGDVRVKTLDQDDFSNTFIPLEDMNFDEIRGLIVDELSKNALKAEQEAITSGSATDLSPAPLEVQSYLNKKLSDPNFDIQSLLRDNAFNPESQMAWLKVLNEAQAITLDTTQLRFNVTVNDEVVSYPFPENQYWEMVNAMHERVEPLLAKDFNLSDDNLPDMNPPSNYLEDKDEPLNSLSNQGLNALINDDLDTFKIEAQALDLSEAEAEAVAFKFKKLIEQQAITEVGITTTRQGDKAVIFNAESRIVDFDNVSLVKDITHEHALHKQSQASSTSELPSENESGLASDEPQSPNTGAIVGAEDYELTSEDSASITAVLNSSRKGNVPSIHEALIEKGIPSPIAKAIDCFVLTCDEINSIEIVEQNGQSFLVGRDEAGDSLLSRSIARSEERTNELKAQTDPNYLDHDAPAANDDSNPSLDTGSADVLASGINFEHVKHHLLENNGIRFSTTEDGKQITYLGFSDQDNESLLLYCNDGSTVTLDQTNCIRIDEHGNATIVPRTDQMNFKALATSTTPFRGAQSQDGVANSWEPPKPSPDKGANTSAPDKNDIREEVSRQINEAMAQRDNLNRDQKNQNAPSQTNNSSMMQAGGDLGSLLGGFISGSVNFTKGFGTGLFSNINSSKVNDSGYFPVHTKGRRKGQLNVDVPAAMMGDEMAEASRLINRIKAKGPHLAGSQVDQLTLSDKLNNISAMSDRISKLKLAPDAFEDWDGFKSKTEGFMKSLREAPHILIGGKPLSEHGVVKSLGDSLKNIMSNIKELVSNAFSR